MERFRTPEFWLKFAAYALPIGFLLYVLYWNFLPFGYKKTFTIQVGSSLDTNGLQELYLEPARDLSGSILDKDGNPYRSLSGIAYIIFKPKIIAPQKNYTVNISGQNIAFLPPVINFDPSKTQWQYNWDFSSETPSDLTGNAFHFDDGEYFDGQSHLEKLYSSRAFESGKFTVYASWLPENSQDDFQEIIGHYNWELLQNKDNIEFRIGRMDNNQGLFYSVKYAIDDPEKFFNMPHIALASYVPTQHKNSSGYMYLYIDGTLASRLDFGNSVIWTNYNDSRNLTLGKSGHGISKFFMGKIYSARFGTQLPDITSTNISVPSNVQKIPVISTAEFGIISKITITR